MIAHAHPYDICRYYIYIYIYVQNARSRTWQDVSTLEEDSICVDIGWTETTTLKQAVLKCSSEECLGLQWTLPYYEVIDTSGAVERVVDWREGFPEGNYETFMFSSCISTARSSSNEGYKIIWKDIPEQTPSTPDFDTIQIAFSETAELEDPLPTGWMKVDKYDIWAEGAEHGWLCGSFAVQGGSYEGCGINGNEPCEVGYTYAKLVSWNMWYLCGDFDENGRCLLGCQGLLS